MQVTDIVLDRQGFNVAGAINNSINKTYPIIVTLTGPSSTGTATVDPNPWPGAPTSDTYTLDSPVTLTPGTWTLNVQVNDGGATNAGIYVGFDGFEVQGTVASATPEPSTLILATLGLLSLGMTRRRRQR